MNRFEKIINYLARKTSLMAQAALALVMMVIVANILVRTWWKPLPGSYELVEILGALILSMGVAYCAQTRGHVTVTLVADKLSRGRQAVLDSLVHLISFIFISALGWGLIQSAFKAQDRSLETSTLGLPLYPVHYLVAAGIFMLALTALLDFCKAFLLMLRKESLHGSR
ncbi:MAG: TRAP transporter small permease [Desulfonatronovibrionaceae bacterium]